MRALVTGGTGFIGRRLLSRLTRPVLLSRSPQRDRQIGVETYGWDPMAGNMPPQALEGIDTVINLAGEPVAGGRWTDERKRLILESRVQGTRQLVETMRAGSARPSVLISASAVGYYGSRGDEVLDESAGPGSDFLAEVCVAWEREAQRAVELGVRVVCLRIGVVMGPGGGALSKMLLPFKLGIGGRLGNGNQWMPWVHVDDLVSLMLHVAERSEISGPVNGVAPNPVTNREFTRSLAAAVHRPAIIPTPYFALRLLMGEFAEVLFASQRVVPKAAEEHSFRFQFPDVGPALKAIV